jgi:hypothetical protein
MSVNFILLHSDLHFPFSFFYCPILLIKKNNTHLPVQFRCIWDGKGIHTIHNIGYFLPYYFLKTHPLDGLLN